MVTVRWNDGTVGKFFPFSLEKVQDEKKLEVPAKAQADGSMPAVSVPAVLHQESRENVDEECKNIVIARKSPTPVVEDPRASTYYLCEIVVEGKIQRVTLSRSQLTLLPGKPCNLLLGARALHAEGLADKTEKAGDEQEQEQEQHAMQTPWKVGALVGLVGDSQQLGLLSGRGAGAVGCIASVDLEKNKVRVSVPHGLERHLSQYPAKVGDTVRLAHEYASVGDAQHGPLKPGDSKGRVLAFREGLVLVRVLKDEQQEEQEQAQAQEEQELANQMYVALWQGGKKKEREEGDAEEVDVEDVVASKWWYEPDALAHDQLYCTHVRKQELKLQEVEESSASNRGVYFDLVNTSPRPIMITGIVAGAYGSSRDAKLFACSSGGKVNGAPLACQGNEKKLSEWRIVAAGMLQEKKSTPVLLRERLTLAPGQVQGFLLHTDRDGVRYSPEGKSYKSGGLVVRPWHATCSSSPHDSDYESRSKYCFAGRVLYENVTGHYDAPELDLKHLRVVRAEGQQDVPAARVVEFIATASLSPPTSASSTETTAEIAAAGSSGPATKQGSPASVQEVVPDFPEDEADINAKMHAQKTLDDQETASKFAQRMDAKGTRAAVIREDSSSFYQANSFEVITKFEEWVSGRDRAGNTVAHHLAMAHMPKSLKELYAQKSALRWVANDVLETPQMLCDGIQVPSPVQVVLHRAIYDGGLLGSVPAQNLVRRALNCPPDYKAPLQVEATLAQAGGHASAVDASSAPALSRLCSALELAMMEGTSAYSPKQVMLAVREYLEHTPDGPCGDEPISPVLYLVRLLLYRKEASKSKLDRQCAACALSAIECFPAFAAMPAIAKILKDADREGILSALRSGVTVEEDEVDEDDEEDFAGDAVADAVAEEWKSAKADHRLASASMDQLMMLTGLTDIKKKALGIVKEVLLQKSRPASVKADTSMNFLFTGNPGCGKTTVARLLAKAMSELGFRSNPQMVETSAQDILKLKDPASDFAQMFDSAKGGTLFIDEAYRFSPAGAGSQPNASNQVLDFLLEAVEKPEVRSTTTVILAGYRDEIEDLLAYNVGFSSRFPLEFAFEDYSEGQLRQIWCGMVKDRGMQPERKKACGVSISSAMAARIHEGAGTKGFGNARAVRNKLEQVITAQSQRIGTRKLRKLEVSEADYKTLTALDALGPRPNFSHCQPMRAMEAMVGLGSVKAEFQKLVSLSQQNIDREMRGDKPEQLSLHRVFYGNPGTGKTTVAKMYGALLKELGLLSKGDFISVTPADLTGDAEGGAASNTKAVLERAKGKVLLIDEAYVLDPRRKNNQYGGNVLDTLVEKLDGEAGSDIAVVLAGYKQEMYDMLDNNAGLRRRFNIDDFGISFTDFSDEELKAVLISMAAKCGLVFDDLELVDAVVSVVGQKRRLPGFGNAGTVASMLNFAKAAKAGRLQEAQQVLEDARRQGTPLPVMPDPDVLIRRDFIPEEEADPSTAREAFANLYNIDYFVQVLDKLEALTVTAKEDGRDPADVLADSHMVFVGPPGTGKTTVAQSFGKLFKDLLKILPSDKVTTVTGTSLMGQYVGETKENLVLEIWLTAAVAGVVMVLSILSAVFTYHHHAPYAADYMGINARRAGGWSRGMKHSMPRRMNRCGRHMSRLLLLLATLSVSAAMLSPSLSETASAVTLKSTYTMELLVETVATPYQ